MRAIVTGGAGFIGSHVVDALVARGDEVAVVDSLVHGTEENVSSGADLHVRDIREPLDDLFDEVRPEAVFHLAAQADVRVSVEHPVDDAAVNVLGTVRILEAARQSRRAGRLRLDGWRDLRRVRGAGARGQPDRAALAVRHREARGRGVSALVQPPPRNAAHRASLRKRLRPAPGPARRGGRRRDLPRRARARRAGDDLRRRGRRPATTSTSATSRAPRRRRWARITASSTSEPGARPPSWSCTSCARAWPSREETAEHAPARMGELQRSFLDPELAARELGFTAMVELEDGLRATWDWIRQT